MLTVQNINKNRKQGRWLCTKGWDHKQEHKNRKQLLLSMVQVGVGKQKKWLMFKYNFAFEKGFKGRTDMLIFWGVLKI